MATDNSSGSTAKDDGAKDDGAKLDVAIEKDTVTTSDQPPGLAAVYVGKASAAAADDIADLLVNATNGRPFELLVVTGGSVLADTELASSLRLQIDSLTEQLRAVGIEPAGEVDLQEKLDRGELTSAAMMGFAPVATAAASALKALEGLPVAGIGLFSKLTARQYSVSGVALDHPTPGLDLRVAGAVRSKLGGSATAEVFVERFWNPPASAIARDLAGLASALQTLSGQVAEARADAARAQTLLDDALVAKTRANDMLVELSKVVSVDKAVDAGSAWSKAWAHAQSSGSAEVTALAEERARTSARSAQLESLQTTVATFIATTLTPPASGSSLLARAVRAEWLGGDESRVVLYVGNLAGGVDEVLETKLGTDSRVVLAGLSVEYAAVDSAGVLLFSGVFDNLWGGTMNLKDLKRFSSDLIDYVAVPAARRVEPKN